jgi:hypothetical protein
LRSGEGMKADADPTRASENNGTATFMANLIFLDSRYKEVRRSGFRSS